MAQGSYRICVHAVVLGQPCPECPGGIASRSQPREPVQARARPSKPSRAATADYVSAWQAGPVSAPERRPAERDCPDSDCGLPLYWTRGNTSQVCDNGHWHLPLLASGRAADTSRIFAQEKSRKAAQAKMDTPAARVRESASLNAGKFKSERVVENWLALFNPGRYVSGSDERAVAVRFEPMFRAALMEISRAPDDPMLRAAEKYCTRIVAEAKEFVPMLKAELKRLKPPVADEYEPEEISKSPLDILAELVDAQERDTEVIDSIRQLFPNPDDAGRHAVSVRAWLDKVGKLRLEITSAVSMAELKRAEQRGAAILQQAAEAAAWFKSEIEAGRAEIPALPAPGSRVTVKPKPLSLDAVAAAAKARKQRRETYGNCPYKENHRQGMGGLISGILGNPLPPVAVRIVGSLYSHSYYGGQVNYSCAQKICVEQAKRDNGAPYHRVEYLL